MNSEDKEVCKLCSCKDRQQFYGYIKKESR